MFSVAQKREIADRIQEILRSTNHPELPQGEIFFHIHIRGAESWSWADIMNNSSVENPGANPHNEMMAERDTSIFKRKPEPESSVEGLQREKQELQERIKQLESQLIYVFDLGDFPVYAQGNEQLSEMYELATAQEVNDYIKIINGYRKRDSK